MADNGHVTMATDWTEEQSVYGFGFGNILCPSAQRSPDADQPSPDNQLYIMKSFTCPPWPESSSYADFSPSGVSRADCFTSDSEPPSPEKEYHNLIPAVNKTQRDSVKKPLENFLVDDWQMTKAGIPMLLQENGTAMFRLGSKIYDVDIDINIGSPYNQSSLSTLPAEFPMYADGTCAYPDANNNTDEAIDCKPNISSLVNGNVVPDPALFQNDTCHSCHSNRRPDYSRKNANCRSSSDRSEGVDDNYRASRRRPGTRTEKLWEFILRLLTDNRHNPSLIEWVDRSEGTFRLNNSRAIAHMWGMRKNNEQMTYEKLSRALRYYYHRHILEPVYSKKLVYRFGPKAEHVWDDYPYHPQGDRCNSS